jgi:hypothetical protein
LNAALVEPVDAALDAAAAPLEVIDPTALVLADALAPNDGVAVAVALAARETSFAQVTFSGTE